MTALAMSPTSLLAEPSRLAPLAIAIGSAGVVVTSILYGVSPPTAAMPLVPLDLAAAVKGAVDGALTMRLAGTFGIFADVLITAGGLMLGLRSLARGEQLPAFGWFLIAISTVIFAVVDSLVGFVLTPVASAGEPSVFLAVKSLFDILFLLGTATFGAGAIAAMMPDALGGGTIPPTLARIAALIGLAGLIGGVAGVLGLDLHLLLAIGLLGGSSCFTVIGVMLARA